MSSVSFVNISHPGEVRSRRVQGVIRRHVMKDIGRSRRKHPRVEIVPLELRLPSRDVSQGAEESGVRQTAKAVRRSERPSWSPNPNGILGVDLDDRILQIVHFS